MVDPLVAREREFIAREEASLDFQEALLDAQQRAIDEQREAIRARRRSLEDDISLAERRHDTRRSVYAARRAARYNNDNSRYAVPDSNRRSHQERPQ